MKRRASEENRLPGGELDVETAAVALETGDGFALPLELTAEIGEGQPARPLLLLRAARFPGLEADFASDLVHHYLHVLARCPHRPWALVLLGQAVQLLAGGSPVETELLELAERGCQLLVCSRSLEEAAIAVAAPLACRFESLNSMQLMETLTTAERVITLT